MFLLRFLLPLLTFWKITCEDLVCEKTIPLAPEIFENFYEYREIQKNLRISSWIEFRRNVNKLEPQIFKRNDSNYIQKINLENKGIRTISAGAFDDLFCLQILNLKLNFLDDLTPEYFRNLVNLEAVDLSHNKLERVPEKSFEKLGALLTLDLSHNNIKHLGSDSFLGLFNLFELNLDYNEIIDFPNKIFRPLVRLNRLHAGKNHISVITSPSLEFLENLVEADFSQNGITYIYENMFKALPKLESLDFSGNSIKDLSIQNLKMAMPALTKINLFQNNFEYNKLEKIFSELKRYNISLFLGTQIIPNPSFSEFGYREEPKTPSTTPSTSSPDINFFDDSSILAAISNLKSYVISVLVIILIFGILLIAFRAQLFSKFNRNRGLLQFQNSSEDLALLQR